MTVLYARISEDRSGLAAGVGRQVDDARRLADRRGWAIAEEYVDNDISALTGQTRPRYAAMMTAVAAGDVERIVVYQTSRLWRNRRERAEGIEALREHRIQVAATKGPELDMSTASGRAMAGLLGEFDTMESEIKAERVQRAALARAIAGGNHGGRRAYGYTPDGRNLVPAEVVEVVGIFETFVAGGRLGPIVRDLNARGIVTVTGRPWTTAVIRDMLRNSRYAGLSSYHGEVVGTGQWPAIVSEETWRLAVAILRRPDRKTTTGNRASYLLSGLARCDVCAGPITSGGRRSNGAGGYRWTYRCRGCMHVTRRRDWVDEYVTRLIVARLSRDDASELLVDADAPDYDALAAETRTLDARLEEIAAMLGDGEITRAQARTASGRVRERLVAIGRAQEHTSRAPALAGLVGADDVRAAWDAAGLDRQRAVVGALVDVVLLPGGAGSKVFDPDLVQVTFRA